ncbi:UDP-N-acetylmuramoylalanyl-D-glutamyl-2,6-diaminopimelate--D-alanyl-D-alanine ligase [Prosthecomicrobium sp. N25]|uniref:UDP-N-acetylmuramoylalanyl-D-glutamyl-2, 6-diaminopimelate--D-alanyl-D-alanine ligase n=1 Tax=Prosthecomicrobium sp. N25 TaxID=3129254 RepID=UPI003078210A
MTAPLWTLDALATACRGRIVGAPAAAITGISIDSRTILPGEAFFAIRGDVHDGHGFVAKALAAGAGVAVVAEEKLADMPGGGRYVVVDDVLEALRRLGVAARARTGAKIVAVTGSVGKTSTKEALRLVLSAQGRVHASVASFNNHWGVPLTLARMPADVDFGVFEIGMNHAGEITPLTRMVRPHVAIVTTVAAVHLEFFASVDDIARAKAEIFLGLEPGGAAVVNGDIEQTPILIEAARAVGARVVTFGEGEGLDSRLGTIALLPDCSTLKATVLGEPVTAKIGAPGRHVAVNALAVLSAAVLAGADLARAALALADLAPPEGRGQRSSLRIGKSEALLLDESYNANPASMRAAIDLLGQMPVGLRGRRIAVLGDMLELGETGPALHAGLAPALEAAAIDLVFCCGPLMRSLWQALPAERRGAYAETSNDLQPILLEAVSAGDAVMVKGSLGSRMGPIVKALQARHGAVAVSEDASA